MELESLMRSLYMVLGIGLVIFVHELGHFLAARWCKVRVETFSLGFGPKLFGWRRGDTLYQVALLPIGGFCRMAGEDGGDDPARAPRSDDLRAKGVGQRFFIYSGGVLMNMLFGIVVLPMVLFYGVPFDEPLIGSVEPGSGAWHAGLEPGTRVLEVNGTPVVGFEYIANEIALGDPAKAELLVLAPGASAPRKVQVVPQYDERIGIQMIGIGAALDMSKGVVVSAEGAAERCGLRTGDVIVDVDGPLPELRLEQRLALAERLGGPMRLRVRGADGAEREVAVVAEVDESASERVLGVVLARNRVEDLRPNADLQQLDLRVGDRIERVNGRRVVREFDLELALTATDGPARVLVERGGKRVELSGPTLDRARALALASDVALAIDDRHLAVWVMPDSVAAGLLADGDVLLAANGVELSSWEADFLPLTRAAAAEQRPLRLRVAREGEDGAVEQLELTATAGPRKSLQYGFGAVTATYTYRARSIGEAIRVGAQGTWKFATDAWTTVKRMLLGQVSSKNMGGIITIGVLSYTLAGMGLAKLIFFLCMLSVNLAIINALPIPLLDGGHLLFLVIEKLKGSPVSERVFGYSQVVGLVLILTLVIYVTYNDVMRFW